MEKDSDEEERQRWKNFLCFNFFATDKERDTVFENRWFEGVAVLVLIIVIALFYFKSN